MHKRKRKDNEKKREKKWKKNAIRLLMLKAKYLLTT